MEMTLRRTDFTNNSTIGELAIDGVPQCFTLEDIVRPKGAPKVHGQTAIQAGRYEVVITYSNRFKVRMPLLMNVPNFEGIRIHPGNEAANTDGCILLGLLKGPQADWISRSRDAYNHVFEILDDAMKREKVFITIQDDR